MKIVVDMNLSPRWAELLEEAGYPSVHWSRIGPVTAPDASILTYAAEKDYVILTNDLDFGIALAMSRQGKPSVVQIRAQDLRPSTIGPQVILALGQMQEELERGALVTVDPKRTRVRLLSLHAD